MNIDYENIERDLESGAFREKLKSELVEGFRQMHEAGEPLPPPSYYATKIAEIIDGGSDRPIPPAISYEIYQETLLACESARAEVTGETRTEP